MMPAPSASLPPRSRVPRRLIDGFALLIIAVSAADTMPCTPEPVRNLMQPVLNLTGLWQGTWSLFSPVPDHRNYRLTAEIEFADGTTRTWNSPNWRTMSAGQRFIRHREAEFLEKIHEDANSAAWPAFAEEVVRQVRSKMPDDVAPRRVVLRVIWKDIPPPQGDSWAPSPDPPSEHQESAFFTLIYE